MNGHMCVNKKKKLEKFSARFFKYKTILEYSVPEFIENNILHILRALNK